MHNIEPYYNWRHIYVSEEDERSPFFGREYSEFEFTLAIYNYLIHPQWDEFGSKTLYMKVLLADYEEKYQRHGIPFTGVMPTLAMRNGDFSENAFGQPNTIQLTNPSSSSGAPFMCSGGSALPVAANGSQAGHSA